MSFNDRMYRLLVGIPISLIAVGFSQIAIDYVYFLYLYHYVYSFKGLCFLTLAIGTFYYAIFMLYCAMGLMTKHTDFGDKYFPKILPQKLRRKP